MMRPDEFRRDRVLVHEPDGVLGGSEWADFGFEVAVEHRDRIQPEVLLPRPEVHEVAAVEAGRPGIL